MFGRRRQRDFEDEIKSHLELEVERLRAQGMSAEEADRAARRNFGNVGVAEDRFYHGQRFASIQDAGRDLKYGWRALLRTPGFLVTTVGTLGLAIGAVAGMFSVVNTVLLDPLPYPEPGPPGRHRGQRTRHRPAGTLRPGQRLLSPLQGAIDPPRRHLHVQRRHVDVPRRRPG